MKIIPYSKIDNSNIVELECCNGALEGIEIPGVPQDLMAKLPKASAGVVAPEEIKSFISLSFHSVNNGIDTDKSLRIVVNFISRNFACMKLRRSVLSIVLGDKELRLRIKCCENSGVGNYTQAMLAVDLGNTRTCALVCPDIDMDISGFKMNRLELSPHYGNIGSNGVWDSLCVIGRSKIYNNVSPSFVRLGADNDLYLRDGNVFSEGIRSLSTPKRYFWDADSNRSWCVIYPGSKDEYLLEDQRDLELAQFISQGHYHGRHPRAMILEGMIFELLEQAERMLNEEKRFLPGADVRNAATQKKKYITKLAMTYPAAWSMEEVEKYREVIQRGIDCYVSQRCRNIPSIELYTACNEAVAVMVNYIYSETLRFGTGARWLALCGRVRNLDERSRSLRIGVIDIGGGTSDLAITEVGWDHIGQAIDIATLYTAGTNEAGDALIALIIRDIIFDKVFDKIVPELTGDKNKDRRDALKIFLAKEVAPKLRSLTRAFWFPLTIKFLEAIRDERAGDVTITIYDPAQPDDTLSRGFRNLRDAFVDKADTSADERIKKLGHFIRALPGVDEDRVPGDDDAKKKTPESIKIVFDDEDMRKFQAALEQNFRSSPKIFGAAVSAYRCDLMIWSGKTADNPAIRRLFEDQMPVPPEASISMNDYRISNGNFPLTDLEGRLSDSKLATAVGAALHQLLQDDTNLKITADNADGCHLYWGLKDRAGYFVPVFDNDSSESRALSYNGKQMIIYRANSDSPFAFPMPAYEFRRRPDLNIENVNVILTLRQTAGKLDFIPQSGWYWKDGVKTQFCGKEAMKDFELRIRMTDADEIWLDSGNII